MIPLFFLHHILYVSMWNNTLPKDYPPVLLAVDLKRREIPEPQNSLTWPKTFKCKFLYHEPEVSFWTSEWKGIPEHWTREEPDFNVIFCEWKWMLSIFSGAAEAGEAYFSPRVNFLCRLSYGIRVQAHASTSVCTLKIPNTVSHTIVWTHKNTAHADWNM